MPKKIMPPMNARPKGIPTPSPIASDLESGPLAGTLEVVIGVVEVGEVVREEGEEVVDTVEAFEAVEAVGDVEDAVELAVSIGRSTTLPTGTWKALLLLQQELGSGPQQYNTLLPYGPKVLAHGKRLFPNPVPRKCWHAWEEERSGRQYQGRISCMAHPSWRLYSLWCS
jgi:hypothetical protein